MLTMLTNSFAVKSQKFHVITRKKEKPCFFKNMSLIGIRISLRDERKKNY